MTDRARLLADIHTRLDTIPDPCSLAMRNPMSLIKMGLVEDVQISDSGAVTVTLCLTDTACVHFMRMTAFIRDAISPLDGVTSVAVRQTLDQIWTPDRMQTEAA